jgi:hypothetical protein
VAQSQQPFVRAEGEADQAETLEQAQESPFHGYS